MSNSMKIRPVGAELFHEDGRTDGWTDSHDEAHSHFCNLENAPKSYLLAHTRLVKYVFPTTCLGCRLP